MALTWPLIQETATGEDVRTIQYLLTAHGDAVTVDGVFGPQTKAAVQQFQSAHGLTSDGEVGQQTWPQLIIQVQAGASGDAVKAVQSQFHSRAGELAVDGAFGSETAQAVTGFQRVAGLAVDGVVGPNTWNALVTGKFPAHDPQTCAKAVFTAWSQHNQTAAHEQATQQAVTELFSHTFSASDGWNFQGCSAAAGTVFCSWQESNGHVMRIGVEDTTEGPFYAAVTIEFA
jgi:peptidoglycan hydrolase-like protein with peptidoglycan-binding domain